MHLSAVVSSIVSLPWAQAGSYIQCLVWVRMVWSSNYLTGGVKNVKLTISGYRGVIHGRCSAPFKDMVGKSISA